MRLGVIWAWVRAWWWLLALGLISVVLFTRRGRGLSPLQAAVLKRLRAAQRDTQGRVAAVEDELDAEHRRQGEDWQAVKAAGDAAVAPEESEPQGTGPKRHNLDFLLVLSTVLITCCAPSLVPAQVPIEPNPRAMTVAQAFDPAPASFAVEVPEAKGDCAPGDGWWPVERRCVPCPPLAHYQPAGDIPEGCTAPMAGTLVGLQVFGRLQARAKRAVRLEAEAAELAKRLEDAHQRVTRCLERRQTDLQRHADEMGLCADSFEAVARPQRLPWGAVLSSGAVGAVVGGLLVTLL